MHASCNPSPSICWVYSAFTPHEIIAYAEYSRTSRKIRYNEILGIADQTPRFLLNPHTNNGKTRYSYITELFTEINGNSYIDYV